MKRHSSLSVHGLALVATLLVGSPAWASPPQSDPAMEGPQEARPADSAWAGVIGRRVTLKRVRRTDLHGVVRRVDAETLELAVGPRGRTTGVPMGDIRSLHVEAHEKQTSDLLVLFGMFGIVSGAALFVGSTFVIGFCSNPKDGARGWCPQVTLPMAAFGVVGLSVGIPLLVGGLKKRRRPAPELVFTPLVAPSRSGSSLGLAIRF